MPELQQLNKHLIIKSRNVVVVAEVSNGKILNVYCNNQQRCREANVFVSECPPVCEYIIAIRQYLKGRSTRFSIKEL